MLNLDAYVDYSLCASGDFLNWFRKSIHGLAALNSKAPSVSFFCWDNFTLCSVWALLHSFGSFLAAVWALLGCFGPLGLLLDALGLLLGALGPLLASLGCSWAALGRSWAALGRSWRTLVRSWDALGHSWGTPGAPLAAPSRVGRKRSCGRIRRIQASQAQNVACVRVWLFGGRGEGGERTLDPRLLPQHSHAASQDLKILDPIRSAQKTKTLINSKDLLDPHMPVPLRRLQGRRISNPKILFFNFSLLGPINHFFGSPDCTDLAARCMLKTPQRVQRGTAQQWAGTLDHQRRRKRVPGTMSIAGIHKIQINIWFFTAKTNTMTNKAFTTKTKHNEILCLFVLFLFFK